MNIGKICSYHFFLIEKRKSIYEAAILMEKHGIRKLLVVEEEDLTCSPVGFLSSSDIASRVILREINVKKTEIQEILLKVPLFYTTENQKIEEVLIVMADNKIRQMPVVDEGNKLLGMVSIDNILLFLEKSINSTNLNVKELKCFHLASKVLAAQIPEHFNYCEVRV